MKFENCKYDHIQLAAQFISMAEKFLPYAKDEKYMLDMGEPIILHHPCGTIACHGGFGLMALHCDTKQSFHTGADKIAQFLGFEYECDIVNWADDNSEIWGNDRGSDMFYDGAAFGVPVYKDVTLSHIVAHYLSVAKRLLEIKS